MAVSTLPHGSQWVYEIKLDGYRAIALNSGDNLALFSRRCKLFNRQFPSIAEALGDLPEGTVIDGEIVALDENGRPDFNSLQHSRGAAARIHYFAFDLLIYGNRDLTQLPLVERRDMMRSILRFGAGRITIFDYVETPQQRCSPLSVRRDSKESLRRERTASTKLDIALGLGPSIE